MTKPKAQKVEQLVLQIVAHPPRQPRPPMPKGKAAKAVVPVQRPKLKITPDVLARSRAVPQKGLPPELRFKPAVPPPGVIPKKERLALDSAGVNYNPAISWAADGYSGLGFSQGYSFLGYPYLSELAQVPEYRLISEVISTEATRKWIKIKSKQDEAEKARNPDAASTKAIRIGEIDDEFKRLAVRKAFQEASMQDGFFGRSHLYIDTGSTNETKELVTPMGEGGEFTSKKFKKGFLKGLRIVEPVWTYPMNYNATDPLAPDWYKPEVWYVMSKPVHVTRCLCFISKPVPDLLKPSFSFGGLSMSQMAKPYVDNWLETRQAVNDIIQSFSTFVLSTDLQTLLADSGDALFGRADLFNNLRNNRGLMMLNKDTEDFKNVAAPLGSLDKLQAQSQEHMSSVSRIPLVKLLGITPSGLNTTTDGEIETFDDTIHAYQEQFFGPHLNTIFKLAQINIWGQVDPDLYFEFVPLGELTEKEVAEVQKIQSETHKNYIDAGVIDPVEARQSVKTAEHSLYPDIDPDDAPEPQIEPENIKEHEDEGGDKGGE